MGKCLSGKCQPGICPSGKCQLGKYPAGTLSYNRSMYVNSVKMYQFKTKNSEIAVYPLCLDNISKDFQDCNMEKTGLNVFEIH